MPDIRNLAAAVFLHGKLDHADGFGGDGKFAFDAEDGGALEAGGYAAVQILFAGDVQFAHDLQLQQQGDLHRLFQSLAVQRERRGVVHFVGAGAVVVDAVNDLFPRLEFHQSGAVILTQFRQSGPHMTHDLGVEIVEIVVPARGTAAKKFPGGVQLLVNFQAAPEPKLPPGRLHGVRKADPAGVVPAAQPVLLVRVVQIWFPNM